MNKIRKNIRNKELLAFACIIAIFFLVRLALPFAGAKLGEARENELNRLKMDALMDIISDGNMSRAAADQSVSANLAAGIRMKTNLLKKLVTEDGYTGPRAFSGGFVAELQGDSVILPAEYLAYEGLITRAQIEKGLASGSVMTSKVSPGELQEKRLEPVTKNGEAAYAPSLSGLNFLSFGEIADNVVYVDLFPEIEYSAYMDRFSAGIYETLRSADATLGGLTLLVNEQDGEMQLMRQYGAEDPFKGSASPAFLEESIRSKAPSVTVDGQEYFCAYAELAEGQSGGDALHIMQMIPKVSLKIRDSSCELLISMVMGLIFIIITVYVAAVQRYSAENELSEEQAARYQPGRMRKRMMRVGILCILLIFAVAVFVESVGQLYTEMRYGQDMLSIFSGQIETIEQDRHRSLAEEEESWFVSCGEELASLLSACPELNTAENLQETCEILGIDYIMEFDPTGRQTLCSRDYAGFTLNDEQNSEMYDFRRLLYGVASIIHAPSQDALTGLERQLIGVKKPSSSASGMHGALIMALMPDRTDSFSASDPDRQNSMKAARGTSCFVADSSTGEIYYSNNPLLLGKTIGEIGLPESSLKDGYMDFNPVGGCVSLVVTSRRGDSVYYYAVEEKTMFERVVLYGLISAVIFAGLLAMLLVFLLNGYNEKAYEEFRALREQNRSGGKRLRLKIGPEAAEDPGGGDGGEGENGGVMQKLAELLRWDQKLPGGKVRFFLHVGIVVLFLCCLDVLNGKSLTNESYETMLTFLLYGNWMRGLNLFCLCSVLLIVSIAYLVNLVSSLLLQVAGGFLTGGGETVCRLLYSCIKYITAFAVLYFALTYLGFPASTILASLGIVSLAISLGAQDLIADILAGLAIVFDGSFRVGDVVELNGKRGTVMEIGVRSTKLRIPVNNIMVVNNHEISDILNMSKELSEFHLEIRVSSKVSLLDLEEMLNRELPAIGRKNEKIIDGPYLLGVTGLSGCEFGAWGQILTLAIGAMIQQKDNYSVQLFLNREVRLLFEREGIKLM